MGFPYFTHLLSLKSAEEAVIMGVSEVDDEICNLGMLSAIDNIDQTLKDEYESVTGENAMKKKLLYCAALLGDNLITAKELREKYRDVNQEEIKQILVNNAISKAFSNSPDKILRVVKKGMYYFNDLRMPIYILMKHDKEKNP